MRTSSAEPRLTPDTNGVRPAQIRRFFVRTLLRLVLLTALAALVIAAPALADADGPQVELASPAEGEGFYQGQQVQAGYGCLPGPL